MLNRNLSPRARLKPAACEGMGRTWLSRDLGRVLASFYLVPSTLDHPRHNPCTNLGNSGKSDGIHRRVIGRVKRSRTSLPLPSLGAARSWKKRSSDRGAEVLPELWITLLDLMLEISVLTHDFVNNGLLCIDRQGRRELMPASVPLDMSRLHQHGDHEAAEIGKEPSGSGPHDLPPPPICDLLSPQNSAAGAGGLLALQPGVRRDLIDRPPPWPWSARRSVTGETRRGPGRAPCTSACLAAHVPRLRTV